MTIYSSRAQLERIAELVTKCSMLPLYSADSVPGALVEAILAEVHGANVLKTYDFVDVVKTRSGTGWQIKSTKESTPVTWKRAKIPEQLRLIEASRDPAAGTRQLGDAIIAFCNAHAAESLNTYGLQEIGFARLLIQRNGQALYFERSLLSRENPQLFDPGDFDWSWSKAKKTKKKEQLSALHGHHKTTGKKWWAWHGLGENQLHFYGEKDWWPTDLSHAIRFKLPSASDRLSMQDLVELLDSEIRLPAKPTKDVLGE